MNTICYTYLVKFIPTNQYYYGSRTRKNCHPTELFNFNILKPYTTSSKLVNSLLKQFGPECFEWQVRKTFSNKEKCLQWESKVLKRLNVEENPKFLNGDSKQKSYLAIQNNFPTKSISNQGDGTCVRIHIDKPIPPGWVLGNINSIGISTNKGYVWIFNPKTNESAMIDPKNDIPNGWILGRPEKTIKKQRSSIKSKKFHHYHNGKESILIPENKEIPSGFVRGRLFKSKPSGKRKYEYVWITNDVENRQVPKGSIIENGWRLGRKISEKTRMSTAKKIKYGDMTYQSIKSCSEITGVSPYLIRKTCVCL